ncbi:G1 family endopeptidase [Streptomyces sp. SL13]|jgi:hypothetical protein|uniref:G1 family endopeptidase n=1 Tax=Streptantibioticus silvisoli TaxID=2705255 RepID=A0AA90KJA2_9ACTN|nr:G1 family glutamic endopeptidase [Streptantibioticus silvisoli]MDI5961825.1 G1 family endopeptidase [Streptantibioticus silvisoli]MDI5973379.1 G1 family endopeptidase [Streptantibioticus silvisoli]
MGMTSSARGKLAKGKAAAAGMILAAALVPASAGTAAAADFTPQTGHYADSNWGGYVAQGSFTSISGSWVEPSVTCNSTNDLFAPWVGLDGYGSQSVEQAGVQTDCSSGSPVLSAWYEMYPAAPVYWSNPVSEGDTITSSIVSNGGGSYTLTLSDTTQGWTKTVNQNLSADNASAEAVIESPTSSYPSFDQLNFSNITVDGQPFASSNPGSLTSGGYGPGPLNGGDFSMTPGADAIHAGTHASTSRPGTIRY